MILAETRVLFGLIFVLEEEFESKNTNNGYIVISIKAAV